MLRMTVSVGAARAKSYFREALCKGDYYGFRNLEQEIVGAWGGKGAQRLGLNGVATRETFERLCDNLHPLTGERLTPRFKEDRRVGYDINFHVPKSVSIMLELGGDQRIIEAFREAVRDTMTEMEREMQTRVRLGGADHGRFTGEMVFAEFVHFTARPVQGIPDPHLHAHVFAFNATFDPVEERWKAGEFGDLKRDAPYFQAAYHARLAERLTALGYTIERRGKGWEIAGVPERAVRAFSRRTEEIERLAAELDITDPEHKATLAFITREAKQTAVGMDALRHSWATRPAPEDSAAIRATATQATETHGANRQRRLDHPDRVRESLTHARSHSFERLSVVPEKRLLAEALKYGVGRVTPDAVRRLHENDVSDGAVLRKHEDTQALVTTKAVLTEEARMLRMVVKGRGQHDPIKARHEVLDQALSAEQQDAVRHVLESTDSVILVRGRAGTGKTRLMKEVVRAVRSTGKSVEVAAPWAMATHEVLRPEGFANARTVASLLKSDDAIRKLKGQMLWVDEAGQLSVPDLRKLVDLVDRAGARLLLTGDTAQHRSVMRGDALRLLETHTGLKSATLSEIRRQEPADYRKAAEQLARGDLAGGFKTLDKMGAIKELQGDDRAKHLATDYCESVASGRSTLVVSPTHAEGRAVTTAVRDELKARGHVASHEVGVMQLRSKRLSLAERRDPASYEIGDVVEFVRSVSRPRNGRVADNGFVVRDRGVVTEVNQGKVMVKRERDSALTRLPLGAARRFDVFEKAELPLAVGDRIRITKNGRTLGLNGKTPESVHNGSIYTLARVDEKGRLHLKGGRVLARNFGHLTHGYCVTSDASQGRTIDHVMVAQASDSFPASSKQQWYTSITRGRQRVTVYTDDKARLLKAIGRDTSRRSATEVFKASLSASTAFTSVQALGLWRLRQEAQKSRDAAERLKAVERHRAMTEHRERQRQELGRPSSAKRERQRSSPSRDRDRGRGMERERSRER